MLAVQLTGHEFRAAAPSAGERRPPVWFKKNGLHPACEVQLGAKSLVA
jgi:hypothetical protein